VYTLLHSHVYRYQRDEPEAFYNTQHGISVWNLEHGISVWNLVWPMHTIRGAAGPGWDFGRVRAEDDKAAKKAEALQRRKEQQKQWQQRYRDQTKYLTSQVLPFLPGPKTPGCLYTEVELLEDLLAVVKDVKAKHGLEEELQDHDDGKGAAGLMYGSTVDAKTLVAGLKRSADHAVYVLVKEPAKCEEDSSSTSLERPEALVAGRVVSMVQGLL